MNHEKYQNYLLDLGTLAKEYAREAIKDSSGGEGNDSSDFKKGYVMGFHRLITLMQQQAETFDIPLEDIGLADISEAEFLEQTKL